MITDTTITISGWEDLRQFGINVLTGEACAYNLRLLCDVSEEGREAALEWLGLPHDTKLAAPWNSTVDGRPAVGSIMLDRNAWERVGQFLLFRAGALAIAHIGVPSGIIGIFNDVRLQQYANSKFSLTRNYAHNAVRGRNVHAMTGRVE